MEGVEQIALEWAPRKRRYLTVSEFCDTTRAILDDTFGDFWLSGEISGCKLSAAGHYYFTLKDDRAQIRCACFRGSARFLKFKPKDGVAVLARGRADLYSERGDLQFIVEAIEPQGHGALQLAFEQLKKKLTEEGLFEASRKRELPKLPQRIGIVTSPTGAVVQDMVNVLSRRFPGLHIRIYPALVQGEGSVEAVCRGIDFFSRTDWAEVVIVARGGGSLEDLWTFNDEAVARAIADCRVPVISAIGHETDFTIADFVADLRAPTPSAAAELVICTRQELFTSVDTFRRRLEQLMHWRIAQAGRRLNQQGLDRISGLLHRAIAQGHRRLDQFGPDRMSAILRRSIGRRAQKLDDLDQCLRRLDVRVRFARTRARIDQAGKALEQAMHIRLLRDAARLDRLQLHLTQLSPLKILERGYAIVETPEGHVLKSRENAPEGSTINVRLAEGRLSAQVLPKPKTDN